MLHARVFRLVCLLVLVLLTVLPLTAAAQPGPAEAFSRVLSGFWNWVAAAWSENGCYIDPNGRCAAALVEPDLPEGGCHIDPDGRCVPEFPASSNLDEGCYIDPHGGCRD